MAQLVVVAGISALLGFALSARLCWLVLCALLLRTLIPQVAVPAIMGGDYFGNTHPSNFVVLGGLFGALTIGRHAGGFTSRRVFPFALAIVLLTTLAVVVTGIDGSLSDIVKLLANISLPLICGLIVAVAVQEDPRAARELGLGIVGIFIIQCALIYLQQFTGQDILWEAQRLAHTDFMGQVDRPWGTFDSGLEAGALLAGVIPLLTIIRTDWLRIVLLLGFVGAELLTLSRIPALVGGVAVLYVLFSSGRSTSVKSGTGTKFMTGVAVVIGLFVVWTNFGSGLAARFGLLDGEDESVDKHAAALDYALSNWAQYSVAGGGYRTGSATKGVILETSLENAYFILLFDFGLVFVTGYVLVQALSIIRGLRLGPVERHFAFSGMLLAVMALTSSGFANPSTWAPLM